MYKKIKIMMLVLLIILMNIILVKYSKLLFIYPLSLLTICILRLVPKDKRIFYLFLGVIASGFFGPYISIPGYENIFLFRILLVMHLIFLILNLKNLNIKQSLSLPVILLFFWMSYSVLTLVWSGNISTSIKTLYYQFESIYLIIVCVYHGSNYYALKKTSLVVFLCYFSSLIMGVYEVSTGKHGNFSSGTLLNYLDTRPTGFLMNPNDYASFISIFLCCVIYFVFTLKNRTISWCITGGLLLVNLYLVIQTESRTGFIGYCLIIILILIKLRGNYQALLVPVASFFTIVLLSVSEASSKVADSFIGKERSTNVRVELYEYVWELIKERNFLGVGIGNTPIYAYKYLYGTTNINSTNTSSIGVHNYWLTIISDIGIIGFAFFCSFFVYLIYYSSYFYLYNKGLLTVVPLSILVAFVGISIGSSSISEMRIVWIGLGICLAVINLLKKEGDKDEKNSGTGNLF